MILFEEHKRSLELPICPCLGEGCDLFSEDIFDPAWMKVVDIMFFNVGISAVTIHQTMSK